MTRNDNETQTEVQDTADPPARSGESKRLYDTTGPRMNRRDLLKGLGAAGAAAAVGPGVASADHGDEDPIDVTDDGTTGDGGDYEDVDPVRVAAGGATAGAVIAGPAGAAAGAALGGGAAVAENEFEILGNWVYGDSRDRRLTQLQSDLHANATSASNNNAWILKELDNRLAVSKNNWIAQAQFDVINAINAGKSEAETVAAGQTGVLEAAATVQKNLLAIESAAIVRYASFNEQEDVAEIADADQVTQPAGLGTVLGVKPLHIDLVNGDTVEAWGLHVEDDDGSGGTVERVVHSHVFDAPLVNTSAPALPITPSSLYELVHECEYNDTDGRVEYVDPSSGDTLRGGGPAVGGASVLRVHHPDHVGTINDQVTLFDSGDVSALDEDTSQAAGIPGYWATVVYPLISTLASEIETYAADAYSAVESGQISTDDLMTPAIYAEELSRDWATAGSTGYSKALLANLGIDTDLKSSMKITVAPSESPGTTLNYGDIGETATFDHTLSNTDSASVTVALDPGGVTDSSGTMQVPGGTETCNVRVQGFADDPSSPSYVVQDVTLTTAAGDTVTVPVSENKDLDGTVASGEAWYDDLDGDSDGSVTIDTVEVAYSTQTTTDGTTTTDSYTETAASGAGLAIAIDASGVGWTYADAALATNWRPHGGNPDDWSTAARKKFTFEGVTLTETTDSDVVDVTAGYAHDGSPTTNDGSPDVYTVPSDQSLTLQLTGTLSNVTAVTVTTDAGDTYSATPSSGVASISHTDIAATGESYVIDTVSVEYDNSSSGTSTATAGTVNAELAVTDVSIPEYDFMVNQWYNTGNAGEDDQIVIATTDGEWVDVETGDFFKIGSATDVDGNELQGVVLSDTNRHSLDVSRVEEEVQRAIETQQTIEETTEDPPGGGGGSGGSGGSMGLLGIVLGGGALAWAYQHLTDDDQ